MQKKGRSDQKMQESVVNPVEAVLRRVSLCLGALSERYYSSLCIPVCSEAAKTIPI
jgi:hypothetical protein